MHRNHTVVAGANSRHAGSGVNINSSTSERIHAIRIPTASGQSFGGSYQGFLQEFHRHHDGEGTALDLVKMVVNTFPSFRDECVYEGTKGKVLNRQNNHMYELA